MRKKFFLPFVEGSHSDGNLNRGHREGGQLRLELLLESDDVVVVVVNNVLVHHQFIFYDHNNIFIHYFRFRWVFFSGFVVGVMMVMTNPDDYQTIPVPLLELGCLFCILLN